MTLETVARYVYCACVDFELRLGELVGASYRDVNAAMFFVVGPLVTVGLVVVVLHQRAALARIARVRGR